MNTESDNSDNRPPEKGWSGFSKVGITIFGLIALLFLIRSGEKIIIAAIEYFKK